MENSITLNSEMDTTTPTGLLDAILNIFRDNRGADILMKLEAYDLLHPTFEKRYLNGYIETEFTVVTKVFITNSYAVFYLNASGSDYAEYRVEVIFNAKWYLRTFLFLCMGCLGEDNDCRVCGGSGWGVL